MATSIGQLLKASPEKLLKELEEVRERERLLAQERELLERVLEMLAENSTKAGRPEDVPITIGPLRQQIVRVMQQGDRDKAWFPRQVYRELAARGNTKATVDNVRMTLKRMETAGEVIKPVAGKLSFALPPDGD
jgi:hypothetical protein